MDAFTGKEPGGNGIPFGVHNDCSHDERCFRWGVSGGGLQAPLPLSISHQAKPSIRESFISIGGKWWSIISVLSSLGATVILRLFSFLPCYFVSGLYYARWQTHPKNMGEQGGAGELFSPRSIGSGENQPPGNYALLFHEVPGTFK